MPKLRLALIGAGNLAWNLAGRLQGTDYEIVQVFSRHLDSAFQLSKAFPHIQAALAPSQLLADLDLVIVASSDHGIADIAATYARHLGSQTAVVHTSGSIHVDTLAPFGQRIGVFYPLQTFTKSHLADFSSIPIFLEGNAEVLAITAPLARMLSSQVHVLDSAQRLQVHMGAVFASNFANFMWLLAADVLKGIGQENMAYYEPLMRECLEKALKYGPEASQTGPAKRGDQVTMEKHLELLAGEDRDRAALYALVSRMIGER
jgi:predicted short-subunit dehydrogenase-like oxidoreductase (DUF2520 family)